MFSPNFSKLLILVVAIFSISTLFSSADLEQKLLSVNPSDKKVTFTFYHFDSSKFATLTDVAEDLGKTSLQQKSSATISASAQTQFTYQSGKFIFPSSSSYFIKNAVLTNPTAPPRNKKFTFILTSDSGRHAICYAPIMNEDELGYALLKYIDSSKAKYTTAVIIDSGNQCGFYKSNGKYLSYYLKELKKPAKAITVK